MARRDPHDLNAADPLLFQQFGWDWRWLSAGRVAAGVEEVAASLRGLPEGISIAFDGRPSWPSVVADLAIQAAGREPLPCGPEDSPPRGKVRWLPMPEEGELPQAAGLERLAWPASGEGARPKLGSSLERGTWPLLVMRVGGFAGELGVGPVRDVVVLGHPLSDPLTRATLAWALVARAAIVLEPQLSALRATTLWARPTVLAATAAELADFASDLAKMGRRAPFGRLRAVLLPAREDLPAEVAAVLAARGIGVYAVIAP